MNKQVDLLVVAAGKGTRANLPYPKTLYEISGQSILSRILEATASVVGTVFVVVSPDGKSEINAELSRLAVNRFELIIQPEPKGMGDAVLMALRSDVLASAHSDILLIWGDIPFLHIDTIETLVETHVDNGNDLSFVTKVVSDPYTLVLRDEMGRISEVQEMKQRPCRPEFGERDIGVFVFDRVLMRGMLEQELPGKIANGEFGFLYIIGHFVRSNKIVAGYPIAKEFEDKSLNSVSDISVQ